MAGGKLSGNVVTTTEIHLIRRPAGEGRVRNHGVVRATRPVVEPAGVGEAAPGTEAGWRQPQDAQGNGERDGLLGGSDGGQERALGPAVGHPLRVEAEAREPERRKARRTTARRNRILRRRARTSA
jgi:hypothetical protein